MSAATGKDITGWLRGGMKQGEPAGMGWWDRACAAAGAAVKIAAGGLRLLSKLKDILQKIEDIVDKAKDFVAKYGRKALCKLTGGCFLAGTLVAMADGTFVPIEEVLEGESVRCELPSAFPGRGGEEMDRPVTQTAGRVYEGVIITLVVQQGEQRARVSGTPEHPFWVVGRHAWVPMGQVEIGERLDGAAGDVAVVGREVAFARVPVFNFGVEQVHSYRVTGLGLLVHNHNPCDVLQSGGRKITESTAEALNDYHGTDLHRRDWGRKLEDLKRDNGLRNDHHGKILRDGTYVGSDGTSYGSIGDY